MTIGVYMIEHVDTGRRYVGKSVDIEARVISHFEPSRRARSASFLHSAISKYGRDSFRWSVLEECPDDESARRCEVVWIRALKSKAPNGFNLTEGGDGAAGLSPSPETRAKVSRALVGIRRSELTRARMSEAQKGNNYFKGQRQSPTTRAKISAALKGHPVSVAAREKMSKAKLGRRHSDVTKARMSASHRARLNGEEMDSG